MRKYIILFLISLFIQEAVAQEWQAKWISVSDIQNDPNTWLAFRKKLTIEKVPEQALAKIAADSKYWLWVNNNLVVFEGGLKRGPNPEDTYYDEVDVAPWLRKGKNIISLQVLYFGKHGFAHKSSGKAGLIFDCQTPDFSILSDSTWEGEILAAYRTAGDPQPNYRLSESNILYDARQEKGAWKWDPSIQMKKAVEIGSAGSSPWNDLEIRPIPLFKESGLQEYTGREKRSFFDYDTIIADLPYNAQITPFLKIKAPKGGEKITMFTDNYLLYDGGANYIRSEYITRKGIQEYESLGWINGHKVYYVVPKGVKVLGLKYRESGYDTKFSGSFTCSDPFFNKLWNKSQRTLYLTMRDNYMDCPDRERAQWSGDAVNQSAQAFYALSSSSHSLSRKWLKEIVAWQRPNGVLYAPVPSGNWEKELPGQMLATVGFYGLWNYYLHTGDRETLAGAYGSVKKYLELWEPDGKGMVKYREGNWAWGDWGDEKDIKLIYSIFYYMALKGMKNSATTLGHTEDAVLYENSLNTFREAFNKEYWTGKSYRHPSYVGKTDDRVQALAVVSGIADEEKYKELLRIFRTEKHASPYIEKYVMEALFQMGEVDFALERHKKRFERMVEHPKFSTLWEGWNFNDPTYGGGTINHSWSGGGLTVLSQYLCGIAPLEAGYRKFQIIPQPGNMKRASARIVSVAGEISSSFENTSGEFILNAEVPEETLAIIGIPSSYNEILLDGKVVWKQGKYLDNSIVFNEKDGSHIKFSMRGGKWKFTAR